MKFERCQIGGTPDESNYCDGEAGRGLYAYVPSAAMRRYYTKAGESVYTLKLVEGYVVDLTGDAMKELLAFANAEVQALAERMPGYQKPRLSASNIQRYGRIIEQFIARFHPDAVAYIVPHKGPGIPTGKQVVVKRLAAFEVTQA